MTIAGSSQAPTSTEGDNRHADARRLIALCIEAASVVLALPADDVGLGQAGRLLDDADELLSRLIADVTLDVRIAQRLETVRDELGSHLCAAANLGAIDTPPQTIADLLRRGAADARTGVAAVDAFPSSTRATAAGRGPRWSGV